MKQKTILTILAACIALSAISFSSVVNADGSHYWEKRIVEVTNITELTNTTEIIDTYNNYVNDQCQGVAIAQAGANNQMYLGTHKPQLSLGIGECDGEVAGSLMFGVKPCKNCPLVNGSIAIDDDVDAYGLGATWIFR